MVTNANIEATIAAIAELENVRYVLGMVQSSGKVTEEELHFVNHAAPLLNSYKLELAFFNMDVEAGDCMVDSASTLQSFVAFAIEGLEQHHALQVGLEVISREALTATESAAEAYLASY